MKYVENFHNSARFATVLSGFKVLKLLIENVIICAFKNGQTVGVTWIRSPPNDGSFQNAVDSLGSHICHRTISHNKHFDGMLRIWLLHQFSGWAARRFTFLWNCLQNAPSPCLIITEAFCLKISIWQVAKWVAAYTTWPEARVRQFQLLSLSSLQLTRRC